MALEYMLDENGLIKEVRMPIADWNALKEKYPGIEAELSNQLEDKADIK